MVLFVLRHVTILMTTLSVKEGVLKAAFVLMEKYYLKESVLILLDAQVRISINYEVCVYVCVSTT